MASQGEGMIDTHRDQGTAWLVLRRGAVCTVVCLSLLAVPQAAVGCPFCDAVAPTLRQEIGGADAGCLGIAVPAAEERDSGRVQVRITQILKGADGREQGAVVEAEPTSPITVGQRCLLLGRGENPRRWQADPIGDRLEAYLVAVCAADGELARLRHCFPFLEDADAAIAEDAYGEFAGASYKSVRQLAQELDHDQLVVRVRDVTASPSRRRLSLTLLGGCGDQSDLPLLVSMLRDREQRREGLDALVACYLSVAGEAGLPLIEQEFLANPEASLSELSQAIAAIRFLGTEATELSRTTLASALAHVLSRPAVADLVIADLARWKDWTQVDRLVAVFEESKPDDRLLRVAIVHYLQACPTEQGHEALRYVHEIDPDSVQRASQFFAPARAKAK